MKALQIEWTEHLDTAEKRENFEKTLRNNTLIFARIQDILNKWDAGILRAETKPDQYSVANWEVLQAHRNGNREIIQKLRDLVSFV
jgi:hypothetical protein